MQPELFPAIGTPVSGARSLAILRQVADQSAANAFTQVDGMQSHLGARGNRLAVPRAAQLQCFEIRGPWKRRNPVPNAGASSGLFACCDARPLTYWWDEGMESHWECAKAGTTRIFWAVGPPESKRKEKDDWREVLYPLYGIGQWVWCIFDYQADVWRVLHAFDDIVRFRLIQPMVGCGKAKAYVIGYRAQRCRPKHASSSSSSPSSSSQPSSSTGSSSTSSSFASSSQPTSSTSSPPSVQASSTPASSGVPSSGTSCASGFSHPSQGSSPSASHPGQSSSQPPSSSQPSSSESSSSQPSGSPSSSASFPTSSTSSRPSSAAGPCLPRALNRGKILVHDRQGIVNLAFPGDCIAPACTTGWAKWMADQRRFEVVSYGRCQCQPAALSSSSSSSPSSSSPPSSSSFQLPSGITWPGSGSFTSSASRPSRANISSAGIGEVSSSSSITSSTSVSSAPSGCLSGAQVLCDVDVTESTTQVLLDVDASLDCTTGILTLTKTFGDVGSGNLTVTKSHGSIGIRKRRICVDCEPLE